MPGGSSNPAAPRSRSTRRAVAATPSPRACAAVMTCSICDVQSSAAATPDAAAQSSSDSAKRRRPVVTPSSMTVVGAMETQSAPPPL